MYLGGYHHHHRPRHHEERNMEYGIWNEEPLTDFATIRVLWWCGMTIADEFVQGGVMCMMV